MQSDKSMRISISKKILLLVLIPCLLIGVVVSIVGSNLLKENITTEIESKLKSTAYNMYQTTQYCTELPAIQEVFDEFYANAHIDVTMFEDNVRVVSTIPNAVGTKMDEGILADIKSGNHYFATNAMVNGEPYFGYYIPTMVDGVYVGASFSGIPQGEANDEISAGVVKLVIAVICVTILAIILSLFIIRQIIKAIDDSKELIEMLHNNDLSVEYKDKRNKNRDEVEEIYNNAYDFAAKLREIVSGINTKSTELNNISAELKGNTDMASNATYEISQAIDNVAQGAESQANDTQNVTERIAEMSDNIDNIQSETITLSEKTNKMLHIKDITLEDISGVENINNTIRADVEDVNKQIDITSDSMESIKKIIAEIQDISSQTNLLSLNASIEAARAGEHGRGFAVVATEVGQLAEQSSKSASEIEITINELLNNFNLIIQKMKVTTTNINEQNEKITRAEKSFFDLETDIKNISDLIKEISAATDELNKEKKSVVDIICNLSAISEENSASTEEVMAGIEELNAIVTNVTERANVVDEHAKNLLDIVNVFKLS
ncbi:MAG: methyl-accepting chemotaxis protein [Lachnospiraceae bacterium]|nr:methyl-accepting chemotaxis protein [Lachnospiraceae bacterium]